MPTAHRLVSALFVAVSGAAVMVAIMGSFEIREPPFVIAAFCGAFVSGYGFAGFFGLPGRSGIAWATLGAVLATLVGAAVAGLGIGLWDGPTLMATWFAPLFVAQSILAFPGVLLVWVVAMTLSHLVMSIVKPRLFLPS